MRLRAPYPSNQITSPLPEASGDRPPLPPQFLYGARLSSMQPRMPGTVPSFRMPVIHEAMPSNFEISPLNNLNVGLHFPGMMRAYTPAFHDPRKSSPSRRGIDFHEGRRAGSSNVGCGTSNGIDVCRLFRSGKGCAYGDKCRYLHEIPGKTMDYDFSSQNFKVGRVVSGHVMDRRSKFDQSKEVRTTGQKKIGDHSEIPKPEYFRTRPCYLWQTTGHCSYGKACRFIHGETELQKPGSCRVSERGSVDGTSATTSAAVEAGLSSSRGIETDCEDKGSRMKQFFESKEFKKLIGIYADWLED